jgi:hypothetical protein
MRFYSVLHKVLILVPFPALILLLLLRESKKMQIKLVTKCDGNKQQQDAKYNAEL